MPMLHKVSLTVPPLDFSKIEDHSGQLLKISTNQLTKQISSKLYLQRKTFPFLIQRCLNFFDFGRKKVLLLKESCHKYKVFVGLVENIIHN